MPDMLAVFWFRRDLRLVDNCGLFHALTSGYSVLPLFVFDEDILKDLTDKQDRRVSFIYDHIQQLQAQFTRVDSSLMVRYGRPADVFRELTNLYPVQAVYTNHDYEPYACQRDQAIAAQLKEQGIAFNTFKDQVIFERNEVLKEDGSPYTVYTPYSKKWKALMTRMQVQPYPSEQHLGNCLKCPAKKIPELEEIGFKRTPYLVGAPVLNPDIAKTYHNTRNIPGIQGTTGLSVHLRFGTVSVRQIVLQASTINEKLLNELIWREFFMMILWHFPHTITHAFKPAFDRIQWRQDEEDFERWRTGQTGYPMVDAGMRELMTTGFMHNRTRMITASFLCKHLLIDWRLGESWFAKNLIDFDLAQNVGNWQWVAGTGVDAAPYFRIFNPQLQAEKFDPTHEYVNKWVPDRSNPHYQPMIAHELARKRCLQAYQVVAEATEKINKSNPELF